MPDPSPTAQTRANQIRAFQAELAALEAEGLGPVDPDRRAAIEAHHRALLMRLAHEQGADTTESLRQLSLGLRIATVIGAVALATAVVFFVRQVWGGLPMAGQLALALAAPLAPLGVAEAAARRDRMSDLTALFAVVAVVGFVADLELLRRVLNLPIAPYPILACAVFALLLAYRFVNRFLLAVGLAAAIWWTAAALYSLGGGWFTDFILLPETALVPAAVVLALPAVLRHAGRYRGFDEIYRVVGIMVAGLAAATISTDGRHSLLLFGLRGAEIVYTLSGFGLGIGALVVGVRRGWRYTIHAGSVLVVLLMTVKAVDWWWNLMPAWLFFLVLGGLAVGSIIGLRRLRALALRTA